MRELEASLQQFAEFLLKGQLMRPNAAPFAVRWVRSFLQRPAQDLPLGDQVRQFCDALEREGRTTPLEVLHLLRQRIRARHYPTREYQ